MTIVAGLRRIRSGGASDFLAAVLILLLSLSWATGLVYLVVRAQLPSPIQLAVVDGVHLYVGLASLVFFAAVAFGSTRPWREPFTFVLLLLYLAIYATGLLAAFPWPPSLRGALVVAHLLTAVWAVPPTAWYTVHARPRPLGRLGAAPAWLAVGVTLLPLLVIALSPRAVGPLAVGGLGNAWTQSGLQGTFLDRMAATPDGRAIVAGGEGLYVTETAGANWRPLPLPAGLVLGLALPSGPVAVYAGTSQGIFASARIEGPYRRLPFPSFEVHDIAVDPGNPMVLWASSRGGFWRTTDGGQHWISESAGIRQPAEAWAIRYFRGALFGSDASAVYRWDGSRWRQSSDQRGVASFDPTSDGDWLFASSMGAGIRLYDGRQWVAADRGLASHGGSGAIHVVAVTSLADGKTYAATMLDGAAVSTDRGQDWSPVAAGLPAGTTWRVLAADDRLLAATDYGVLSYRLEQAPPPGIGWWVFVALMAVGSSLIVLGLARPRQREARALHQ